LLKQLRIRQNKFLDLEALDLKLMACRSFTKQCKSIKITNNMGLNTSKEWDQFLKHRCGRGLDKFLSSIRDINDFWPDRRAKFGRKRLTQKEFWKQRENQIKKIRENLIRDLRTYFIDLCYPSIFYSLAKDRLGLDIEAEAIKRFNAKPFLSRLDYELEFIDSQKNNTLPHFKQLIEYQNSRGQRVKWAHKVALVWALVLKRGTRPDWRLITDLLNWSSNEYPQLGKLFDPEGQGFDSNYLKTKCTPLLEKYNQLLEYIKLNLFEQDSPDLISGGLQLEKLGKPLEPNRELIADLLNWPSDEYLKVEDPVAGFKLVY